jgi:hypothetical protein
MRSWTAIVIILLVMVLVGYRAYSRTRNASRTRAVSVIPNKPIPAA